MNNAAVFQSSYWARFFLLLAWLLPLLGIFINSFTVGAHPLPPGTGYQDSGRTILSVLCFLGYLFSSSKPSRPRTPAGWLIGLFLLWSLLSVVLSDAMFDALLFWQMWPAAVMLFLGGRNLGSTILSGEARAVVLHLPVLVIAGSALLPLLYEPEFVRIGGVFELAGVLANWLLLLLPLCLHDTLEGKGVPAYLAGLATALALVSIGFSFSRASWLLACVVLSLSLLLAGNFQGKRFALWVGWIAMSTGALIILRDSLGPFAWILSFLAATSLPVAVESATKNVRGSHLLRLGGVLLTTVLLVWSLSHTDSMQSARDMTRLRLGDLKSYDNSSRARVQLWVAAVEMASSNPVIGVGPGEFAANYPKFQKVFYYYSDSAHSAGLELAAEVGWVGLGLFAAGLVALLKKHVRNADSGRRAALLGLFCGLGYAQIDLAYQYGLLWLTVAVVCLYALPPKEPPEPEHQVGIPKALVGLASVALALYLIPPLREMEGARLIREPEQSLQVHQQVLNRLPWWRHALVSAYQIKLMETETLPTAQETERLREYGQGLAIAHSLMGKWYLRNNRYDLALVEFRKAIELDPWNDPSYYGDLRKVGIAISDQALVGEAENALLSKFSFEEAKLAPPGHRENLQRHLQRALFEIADSLNPYYQPLKTEPLYRALYEYEPIAQAAYGLGISLQSQGRTEEAIPYLREAHRKHPMFPAP